MGQRKISVGRLVILRDFPTGEIWVVPQILAGAVVRLRLSWCSYMGSDLKGDVLRRRTFPGEHIELASVDHLFVRIGKFYFKVALCAERVMVRDIVHEDVLMNI